MPRLASVLVPLLALCCCPQPADASYFPSADTRAVCSALLEQYPKQLAWDPLGPYGASTVRQSGAAYTSATYDYWNAANSLSRAACAFFPSTTDEVAFAVRTLGRYESVRFALKAGGHNANPGFSSTKGGVLIAFRPNFQYATPAPAAAAAGADTVEIGAGCKWEDVYKVLQPLGKTVAGGRFGDVGTTGLILGGGLSYLSAQHGFACDNVLNFETVLANGTVAHANKTSNPELFFALCGGGNRYAVITKMAMQTFASGKDGQVFGGVRTYHPNKHADVLRAVSRFTSENTDPKAAIIPTFNFGSSLTINLPFIVVTFFYDDVEVPDGVFAMFDEVPHLSSDTQVRSFESLTREIFAGDLKGLRFRIAMNSFPAMPVDNMTDFLTDHWELIRKKATDAAVLDALDFKTFSFAVQPMPRAIVQASRDWHGGNALGLKPEDGDRVWMEYDLAWLGPLCDSACTDWLRDAVRDAHDLHAQKYAGIYGTNYESGDLETISYSPIFMNDAMDSQPVLQSYGKENHDRLRAAQAAYDPHGFFMNRQDGPSF